MHVPSEPAGCTSSNCLAGIRSEMAARCCGVDGCRRPRTLRRPSAASPDSPSPTFPRTWCPSPRTSPPSRCGAPPPTAAAPTPSACLAPAPRGGCVDGRPTLDTGGMQRLRAGRVAAPAGGAGAEARPVHQRRAVPGGGPGPPPAARAAAAAAAAVLQVAAGPPPPCLGPALQSCESTGRSD